MCISILIISYIIFSNVEIICIKNLTVESFAYNKLYPPDNKSPCEVYVKICVNKYHVKF